MKLKYLHFCKNNKFIFICQLVLILCMLQSEAVHSEEINIEKKVTGLNCEQYWGVLWPLAKSGNVEARAWIFFLMTSPPGMPVLMAPGATNDYTTRLSDAVKMSVYAQDYKGKWSDQIKNSNTALALYKRMGFYEQPNAESFLKCVEEDGVCSDLAISNKLVPSFKEYAERIDIIIKSGIQSKCVLP